jgi:hypothetical protein
VHEIARWQPTARGQPRQDPAHVGPPPEGPLHRTPKARTPHEAALLAIGNDGRQLISAARHITYADQDDRRGALPKIYGSVPSIAPWL